MKTKKLFLCLLFLVLGTTAWADKYYKVPYNFNARYRVSTLEPGKKYMIFNTAVSVQGQQDRTGFVYNNGTGLSLDKSKDEDVLVYNDCFVFTLEAVDAANNKYALKSLSSGTYVGVDGSTSNSAQAPLYIYSWDKAVEGDSFDRNSGKVTETNGIKQAYVNSENENYTVVFYADITSAKNEVFIITNEDKDTYWNGNENSFATWDDGHPYAFYEVEEVVPTTFGDLNLQDLHIYSRCDIYSAQQIYGYITSASQITPIPAHGDGAVVNLLDGDGLSYEATNYLNSESGHGYEIDLAVDGGVDSFALYMQRRADGKDIPTTIELFVLPVGESEFVSKGTFSTGLDKNANYTEVLTSEMLGGAKFTKIKIVATATTSMPNYNCLGLSELYVLPNTNVITNAFTYFDNSLPVSGTYMQFNEILERYNKEASEVKLLSGVPIPGNKYRIYADAYDIEAHRYVNRHISTNGTADSELVATGNYFTAGDDQGAYEWICYRTSDGSLIFRNVKYTNLYLGYNVVTTDINKAKWTINTNHTQRHGVPLINKEQQYLAVFNSGEAWQGDVSSAQDQTKAYSRTYTDNKGTDDIADDEEVTINIAGGVCTDFVFIPVPLTANEKRITILASSLAQRNMCLTVGGVEYSLPFSMLFSSSAHLPVLTELASETHCFAGYQKKKGETMTNLGIKVFDETLYNSLESGDTLIAKFEIVRPFEKSNGVKNLYRIKNLRSTGPAQQARPNRASIDIDGGGPISPSSGIYHYAAFSTKNENMSLEEENVDLHASQLFYFTGGEEAEDYYSAFINSAITTKKCKAANEWSDAGQIYYVQPNTTENGYTGYTIAKTKLTANNNPADAWRSNHSDGDFVEEGSANGDGATWEFELLGDDDAVNALREYISEQHILLHEKLESASGTLGYCQDKIDAYKEYIHTLVDGARLTNDIAQLVAWSQEMHMLHHEIEYNLLALPTPTDESTFVTDGYNPVWYYVKNVESGNGYATYNGGLNNMNLLERNATNEQTLYNLFYFAGALKKPETINEYLDVHVHNFMAMEDSTLVGANEVLFKDVKFTGSGVSDEAIQGVKTISSTDAWEITAEFNSNGAALNFWGTCLLAAGDENYKNSATANKYPYGFQVYMQTSGALVVKAGNVGDDYYKFEHTIGAYSNIKVVLSYADHRLKVAVTNSLGVTQTIWNITHSLDYIKCPEMKDITTIVTNMPAGVSIEVLTAEVVTAMKWNEHTIDKDTWYVLPSSNVNCPGLAIVMNSPDDSNMGWAKLPIDNDNVQVFTDLGSANLATWQFERVVKFDTHIDQLLELYNLDHCVIYNKELAELCRFIAEKAELIKAGDDDSRDEEYFNMVYDRIKKYDGPMPDDLLAPKAPKAGSLYTIRPYEALDSENTLLVHVDATDGTYATKELYFGDAIRDDRSFDSRAVWTFEGTLQSDGSDFLALSGLKVKNIHTQCYMTALGAEASAVNEDGEATVTLAKLGACTTMFQVGEHYMVMTDGKVTNGGDENTKWIIEEILDPEESVYYEVSTYDYGYNTLKLGFPAYIPEGVEAFYARIHGDIKKDRYVSMVSYGEPTDEVRILPSNTAVVLRNVDGEAAAKDYKFYYSATNATPVADKYLHGALYYTVVDCSSYDTTDFDGDGSGDGDVNIYMLQASKGVGKLYWIYEERSADGTIAPDNANTDNGGYIACKANKSFVVLPKKIVASTTSFSMKHEVGETTEIEDIEASDVELIETIYDVQGRKLKDISAPGVYIVNGKKVLVK